MSLPQRADDEESNQEKLTEEPQVTSVNGRESNVRVAVCAESMSQSASLEGGDPQPTDNHRHLQQREPVTSTQEFVKVITYFGLVFDTNRYTIDLSKLLTIFLIFLS